MELLQIQNLTFHYPQQENAAIDHVSCSISQGEFVVICGVSGCGKTTLLRLCKPSMAPHGTLEGNIFYNGVSLNQTDAVTKACSIGFVQQNPENQIVTDKVWHELAFGLESMGLPNDVIRRRVSEMAQFLGIQNWFHKNTSQLSGGQKQLLNLASVMVMQPNLLILDEPTSQLDPIAASDFIATLRKLNQDLGLTILLVEHRLEEVLPIADKVLLMDQGKLLCCDTPVNLGAYLYAHLPNHPLIDGLPSAMRIYYELKKKKTIPDTAIPLTVKDGRQFLGKLCQPTTGTRLSTTIEKKKKIQKDHVLLELKNIWFRYEKNLPDILHDLSLQIPTGGIYALLGGNGSGKTTLLNVMCGINHIYSGSIFYQGKPLKSYKGAQLYRNNITVLPQNPQLMFVEESIRLDYEAVCKVMELGNEETREEIDRIGDLLSISHLLDRHPYDVSGGELQKAALGKLLLLKPQLIFMDEPTKGLDGYSKKILAKQLQQFIKQGITIVIVTHDVEFAAQYADLCGMLFDGQIISQNTPEEFFSGNNFYTTAANRISRQYTPSAITCSQVVEQITQKGLSK